MDTIITLFYKEYKIYKLVQDITINRRIAFGKKRERRNFKSRY